MSWRMVGRWIRAWRRDRHMAPPPPDPARLVEAREAAERARRQLQEARSRMQAVDTTADSAEKIHARNSLGPAFMKALHHPGA